MPHLSGLMAGLSHLIINLISALGYWGVVLLMAIESACVPLPSEIILPFAGFLASTGRFRLFWIAIAGAFGCNLGSMAAYAVGYYGGRPLALRYGRWLLIAPGDLIRAETWFAKHGEATVFISRMLPVVRTYIALPAGVAKMPLGKFHAYTFLGSLPWCWLLAYVGFRLGSRWENISPYFHKFDMVFGPALVVLIIFVAIRHGRSLRISHS
ncbi:MAG TPA: DedA family protein [Terriglobales bacterium]|nr:DedA family protein [Terriglobales bacterium]